MLGEYLNTCVRLLIISVTKAEALTGLGKIWTLKHRKVEGSRFSVAVCYIILCITSHYISFVFILRLVLILY